MAAIFAATFAVLSLFGYSAYFEAKRQKHFLAFDGLSLLVFLALISIPLVLSLKDAVELKNIKYGVDAVISGGMGAGAQQKLAAANIKVYGFSGKAKNAVASLLAGTLEGVKSCAGHSHGEGHTCGHHLLRIKLYENSPLLKRCAAKR